MQRMAHLTFSVFISLIVAFLSVWVGAKSIKYRLAYYKKGSLVSKSLAELCALAAGLSLSIPIFFALSSEPQNIAVGGSTLIWVVIVFSGMFKFYKKYHRIFKYLQVKVAPNKPIKQD